MPLTSDQKTILINQSFFSMYSSLTMSFIVPFVLVLGASNVMVGIILALHYLAIALSQIPGERATEVLGRRVVFLSLVPLGRLLWVVILLVPFYIDNGLLVVMVFYFIVNFLEYFVEPAYLSMMADVVPARLRGWFFSKRNMVRFFFDTALFVIAGFYLDLFPSDSTLGFSNVMLAGVVLGLLGVLVVSQLSSPNKVSSKRHSIRDYFRLKGNFRKFVKFNIVFNFAVMIASPFFTVYMLENLGLSYGMFVTATLVSVLFRMLAQKHLAPITDKFGNRNVAWLMTLGTALSPLLMFFVGPGELWLLFIVQAISGYVWGGHDLSVFNMLLDVTDRENRSFQVSAYVLFTAVPLGLAPVIGGWIADNVVFVIAGIPLIFIISGILRFIASFFVLGLPEVRIKEQYSISSVLRSIVSLHPERGFQWLARHIGRRDK